MVITITIMLSHDATKTGIMADVCDKDLYDLKILEVTDYIKSVSKKKPTKERILKFMARSNLKSQEKFYRCYLIISKKKAF